MLNLAEEMRACRRCLDAGFIIAPGAVFSGKPSAEIMLIGQAPGVTEVEAKRPFNAGSGRRLFQWLEEAGWEETQFRAQQYMTAVTKCYPGRSNNGKGDRVPTRKEQALCRPFLERELRLIKPRLIILVGGLAIKLVYLAGARLDEVIGTAAYFPPATLSDPVNLDLSQAVQLGAYEEQKDGRGRWVVPLPHPSGASLWPNRAKNKVLIRRAIHMLADIRGRWLEAPDRA